MFNSYEYFETCYQDIKSNPQDPESDQVIKKIYKASGLAGLEEVLSDVRNNPDCCLVVRDAGDGFLDLQDKRFDNGYHTIYIMVLGGKLSDHSARMQAKRKAMLTGIRLFDRAKLDAVEFGNTAFGLNFSRIDYSEIGPIGLNYYYGYSFSFSFDNYFS